nr:carboxypeptidase B [Halyomorpha halys]
MAGKEIATVLVLLVYLVSANTRFDGSEVLNVFSNKHHLLRSLARVEGLDVWSQNKTNTEILVPSSRVGSVKRFLDKKKIPYSVMIQNVQKLIDEEQYSSQISMREGFSLYNYHTLDEIYEWMDSLSMKYPELVSIETIGYSHENRPIKVAKIHSGKWRAKAVFLDGGIHAREWISTATVVYILHELVENRSELPSSFLDLDFYLLPVFNPDGYEFTHTTNRLWRKNRSYNRGFCKGTDLNRNFDAHFGGLGTSDNRCDDIYRGPYAFSEPETKAFSEYILKIKENLIAYISFHSYSQFILLPHGYDYKSYPKDFKELKAIGSYAALTIRNVGGETYKVGRPADILYPAAGGAYDWVKETAGVKYSFTYELRDTGKFGFLLPVKLIKPTAIEAFVGVKAMVECAVRNGK